jgi:hypothetical protein
MCVALWQALWNVVLNCCIHCTVCSQIWLMSSGLSCVVVLCLCLFCVSSNCLRHETNTIQQFLFFCALWPANCLVNSSHLPDLTHQNVHLWAFVCAVCGYVHVHALFVLVGAMMCLPACLPACHNVHLCVPWCALVCVTCVTSPSICISSVLDFMNYNEYSLCFQNWFEYTLCLCVCVCASMCMHMCASAGVCLCACVLVCVCTNICLSHLIWSGWLISSLMFCNYQLDPLSCSLPTLTSPTTCVLGLVPVCIVLDVFLLSLSSSSACLKGEACCFAICD